jgi:hypothetical protein
MTAASKFRQSDRELRLTAALYALRPGVLDHVKATGRLPERIPTGGSNIGMQLLIERRGVNLTLTAEEQLVYEAIVLGGTLPGGHVLLVDEHDDEEGGND